MITSVPKTIRPVMVSFLLVFLFSAAVLLIPSTTSYAAALFIDINDPNSISINSHLLIGWYE